MCERALALVVALANDDLAGERADVLAVALGPVERLVGLVLEILERTCVLRTGGDAARDRHAAVAEDLAPADRGAQALGREQRVELARFGQEQPELLAAEAGEAVDRANEPDHDLADLAQDVVARLVAERVVDRLEVVYVEQDE